MTRSSIRLIVVTALLRLTTAILVTKNSPCEVSCGNVLDATTGPDITCDDDAYATTSAGLVFKNCIHCEAASTFTSNGQTDLQWMLYNLRYTTAYCMFGDPGNPKHQDNPCVTSAACGPLKDAIEWGNFTTMTGAYDYCRNWSPAQVSKCQSCLAVGDDQHFVNNFLSMLDAACQQQPAPGAILSIAGDPFSSQVVNVTTPTPSPLYTMPADSSGPVPLGARVGIAIGGIVFLLALAGCGIVCNGKRRRRAYLRSLEKRTTEQGWPHHPARHGDATVRGGQDMFETPVSQRPLRGWEDSPISAGTEVTDRTFGGGRYFSPYSSTYNSPVSAIEAPHMGWPALSPQRLEQVREADPTPPGSAPHSAATTQQPEQTYPPPGERRAFADWPTPTPEQLAQHHIMHAAQQDPTLSNNTLPIGIALGGDEASLRSKASNPAFLGTQHSKSSLRSGTGVAQKCYPQASRKLGGNSEDVSDEEAYEMHEVDNTGRTGSSVSADNGSESSGNGYQYHPHSRQHGTTLPVEQLQQHASILLHHPGYGRRGTSFGKGEHGGLTEQDAKNGQAL